MQYSKVKEVYIESKKQEMTIDTDKLSEESIISLSHIKDKNVLLKIQKHM
jgi:hypothetical protein